MITKTRIRQRTRTRIEDWQVVAPSQALAPVTLGEIRTAFRHPEISLLQMRSREETGVLPSIQVGQRELAILVASILRHPVSTVNLVRQCGRFLLVDYTPIGRYDPQMIVAWMSGADGFHAAMMRFQGARANTYAGERVWYSGCMVKAKEVLGPLARLSPYVAEAEFVIGWLLHTTATGKRI